jgi:hypothetical protein
MIDKRLKQMSQDQVFALLRHAHLNDAVAVFGVAIGYALDNSAYYFFPLLF